MAFPFLFALVFSLPPSVNISGGGSVRGELLMLLAGYLVLLFLSSAYAVWGKPIQVEQFLFICYKNLERVQRSGNRFSFKYL